MAQAWLEGRKASEYDACWKQLMLTSSSALPRAVLGRLIDCLFTRWAVLDMPGSLQATYSGPEIDWQLRETATRGWARGAWTDPTRMFGVLRETKMNEASLQALLQMLAEVLPGPDVAAAYGQLKQLAQLAPTQEIVREIVGAAVNRCVALPGTPAEWQKARSFVAQLPASEFRNGLADSLWLNPPASSSTDLLWEAALAEGVPARVQGWVLARVFRYDRDRAWDRLQSVPQEVRPSVEEAFVATVAGSSPDAVSWLLSKKPVQAWPVRGLSVMVRYFLEHQNDDAIKWMRKNAAVLPDEVWSYAGQFAMENSVFARFWLEARCDTPPQAKKSGYTYATKSLGKQAPDDALSWINGHLNGADRDLALVEQIRLWGGQAPEKALVVLRTIQNSDWFADGRSALFEAWAPRDFAAALKAAKEFPGEDRVRAISNVCEKGARTRPEEAAAAFVTLLQETEISEMNDLVLSFAADDVIDALYLVRGEALFDWLRLTIPPAHRAAMSRHAFHRLRRNAGGDPDILLTSLPEDEIKEVWRQEAAQYGYDTPWQAFRVAVQIRDPKSRHEICRNLAHAWRNLDVAFARIELPKLQLSAEEKTELLAILAQP